MEVAGRILIMPKGEYDATIEYELLDMVSHNGSTWLAKKTSVGVEPSAESSEYWFKMTNSGTSGTSEHIVVSLTQAEYDALTDEEKDADKMYLITDGVPAEKLAENIKCVNPDSEMPSEDVQGVIDELYASIVNTKTDLEETKGSLLVSTYEGDNFNIIKYGKVATLNFAFTETTATSEGWQNMAKIPEEYRPARAFRGVCFNNSATTQAGNTPISINLTASGNLNAYFFADKLTMAPYGTITYITS